MNIVKRLKISIAMATYNGGKYLQKQLDSFLTQTRLPDELVVTDDCSSDNTIQIIQAFAETAPFEVKWKQNENNLGYTANFNEALIRTTGDLVFLCDQDDVWFSEKIERMERYALDNPSALVVMNDAALTDGELNDTGLTKQGQIASLGKTNSSFVMGCCVVVRRELLDICLPIPASFNGHDNWIVKMAEGVEGKLVVSDILQWYRLHDDNTANSLVNQTKRVTRGMNFRQKLMNALIDNNLSVELKADAGQSISLIIRVRKSSTIAAQPLSVALSKYALELEERLAALEARCEIIGRPRHLRLPAIINFWQHGGYTHFSGIQSALRDLLLA